MSHVFPPGFVWGTATLGYQVEGAPTAYGKGPSIWDTFAARPGATLHGDNGNTAGNAYDHAQLEADLDLIAGMGLKAYIFSVQWPRVQPNGRGPANAPGLAYYDRLVDGLPARNVIPALTLYHWELPQALQDRGGWLNRDTVDRFVEYTTLVYQALADRVPIWITQNEPFTSAWLGHGEGKHAPGLKGGAGKALAAAHHLLLSHGRAVQALRGHKPGARTVFGPVLNLSPYRAANVRSRGAVTASMRLDGEQNRFFLDAIFHGRYPTDLRRRHRLATDNWSFVRDGDMASIATAIDFLGINYYMVWQTEAPRGGQPVLAPAPGETTVMGWAIDPDGLEAMLRRVCDDYSGDLPLRISENAGRQPGSHDPAAGAQRRPAVRVP